MLDAIFGDPDFKLHPIRLIGYLISFLEKVMRRIFTKNERFGGAVMAICVLIICGGVPFAILFFAYRLNYFFGIAIESVICYFMLAAKSLKQAGMSVYKPLKNGDVDGARKSVSMIVGRDTESLDDIGISNRPGLSNASAHTPVASTKKVSVSATKAGSTARDIPKIPVPNGRNIRCVC